MVKRYVTTCDCMNQAAWGDYVRHDDYAALEAELARLRAGQDGFALVPVEPTSEMVSAAEEAHMPFGDMDIALRMAILSAPSAQATVQGDALRPLYTCIGKGGEYRYLGTAIGAGDSRGELVEVYQDKTGQLYHRTPEDFMERMEPIAAARKGGGKV